jgi:predicted nucleic acid-binding protein
MSKLKVLLDTNIIIHRESNYVINKYIGQLFNWIDKLNYQKIIHPINVQEINKYKNRKILKSLKIKLESYIELKVTAPICDEIKDILENHDKTINDKNDTLLLNEVHKNRVDVLITEDKNIHSKAIKLKIQDRVFTINSFLENVIGANPTLVNYKVLSIKKELFGNINIKDEFFNSFKENYQDFEVWFNRKSEQESYVLIYENSVRGFLYIKVEDENENYSNISPIFDKKKRLKIGTFKVNLSGLKLGERFLKIVFDNALKQKVEEIYLTIFDDNLEKNFLINLIENFGFKYWGIKETNSGKEKVYIRNIEKTFNTNNPKLTFPFFLKNSKVFFVPIKPEYHTELFPDSILRTESPINFIENMPHRNAINKVFISHSYFRDIIKGNILVFYRTGGYYQGVISTIGIVNEKIDVNSLRELIKICRGKTILNEEKINDFWNKYQPKTKPFVLDFLYTYSFPKRLNLKELIDIGLFLDAKSIPRGISEIPNNLFIKILKLTETDESIIVD